MKTGSITIEAVTIWCKCGNFVAGPDSGSSLIDPEEYAKLPNTITCTDCGVQFKKPAVSSYKVRSDRAARYFR